MIRLRNQTKVVIVLFIIILSVYFGVKKSNIMNKFERNNNIVIAERAQEIFDNAGNFSKCVMKFHVTDFNEVNKKISEIKECGRTLHFDTSTDHNTLVLEIPNLKYDEVLAKIKTIDGLVDENMVNNYKEKRITNIKEKIQNQNIVKNRVNALISKSNLPERVKQFTNQLERTQIKIDSLENLFSGQKENEENSIIMISMIIKAKQNEIKFQIKSFFLNTFCVLFILTFIFFIFYYFMVLMLKLMKLVGIKSAKGQGSSYNYNYSYGGRRYEKRVKTKKIKNEEKKEN